MSVKRYEFNPPSNINAIRSTIMQRIKEKNTKLSTDEKTFDNGLPSPLSESCSTFEDELKQTIVLPEPNSPTADSVPDSPLSTKFESSDAIREKIKLLKEEKHKLFQTMKDLLAQPTTTTTPVTIPSPSAIATKPTSVTITTPTTNTTTTTATVTTTTATATTVTSSKLPPPQTTTRSNLTRTRISEFNSRPISRYNYHERRSPPPPRFYTNDSTTIRGYPYNATSNNRSSTSLNMSRRNSSYVSSRSLTDSRPINTSSFRLINRHSRY